MSEAHVQTTSHDIVNLAAAALSAAPDLTEPERATRFQTVVSAIMEFQPADQAQTMIASLIVGHHLEIMNGFRDLARLTLTPAEAVRTRMGTVSQTKVVPQLLRELRIERKDALTRAAGHGEPARDPIGGAAYDASLAKYLSAYAETLSALETTDDLTPATLTPATLTPATLTPSTLAPATLAPAAATDAREALSQAVSPALFAAPREANPAPAPREANPAPAPREASPAPAPVTGSRAQRRAMMKRNGGFKRHP
jgi:hypothetical protein